MINKINDHLYSIKVRLPRNPLGNLNNYVIRTGDHNLLIDTGFNQPECLFDLQQGIDELGLDMDKTDVLATHFHADHTGLFGKIIRPGRRAFLGEVDRDLLITNLENSAYWKYSKNHYQKEGFPVHLADKAIQSNPARIFVSEELPEIVPLRDEETLTIGGIRLKCIFAPGHTPGHICLYNETDKYMVLGDNVLFDITPNITTWPTLRNSLKSYLESLNKLREYEVDTPLPGHRECHITMAERIGQLFKHHEKRLLETFEIVRGNAGISGYDAASRMSWDISTKNWDEFPLIQKWFAVGETLAHLYYLEENGDIKRDIVDGLAAYTAGASTSFGAG